MYRGGIALVLVATFDLPMNDGVGSLTEVEDAVLRESDGEGERWRWRK